MKISEYLSFATLIEKICRFISRQSATQSTSRPYTAPSESRIISFCTRSAARAVAL